MEMIFNLFLAAIMLAYLFFATQISGTSVTGDIFGAGGFPVVLAILGLILIFFISIHVIRNKTKVKIPMFDFKSQDGKAVILNVSVLTGYLIMMNYIGFLFSTPLFLFGSAKLMGYKKMGALLIYTVVLSAILIIVFGKVFYVPLPRGVGIFRELSYSIY